MLWLPFPTQLRGCLEFKSNGCSYLWKLRVRFDCFSTRQILKGRDLDSFTNSNLQFAVILYIHWKALINCIVVMFFIVTTYHSLFRLPNAVVFIMCSTETWGSVGYFHGYRQHIGFVVTLVLTMPITVIDFFLFYYASWCVIGAGFILSVNLQLPDTFFYKST